MLKPTDTGPSLTPALARFLVSIAPPFAPDDDAAEGSSSHITGRKDGQSAQDTERGGKLSGAQRKKLAKEERKKHRGANKGRRFARVQDEVELCWKVATGRNCEFGSEYVRMLSCVFVLRE